MTILIPCCGIKKYSGVKKQFLKIPNGLPLPVFSANGIKGADKFIYTYIKEDFAINADLPNTLWHGTLCLLSKQTKSQVDTVRQTIFDRSLMNTAIYIKDCDNYFEATAWPNIVTVKSISLAKFKLHNKSYTRFDNNRLVTSIKERIQISEYINVGGYGFASGQMFLDYSKDATHISEVITSAILDGVKFHVNNCEKYIDYGEQDDYDKFIKSITNATS